MEKKRKNTLSQAGLEKSKDEKSSYEKEFEWWLDELKERGIVKTYCFECEKFTLFTSPFTSKQLFSMNDAIYTPDYKVVWNDLVSHLVTDNLYEIKKPTIKINGISFNPNPIFYCSKDEMGELVSSVEIKPEKDLKGGLNLVRLKIKWLNEKGIHINLIQPIGKSKERLFRRTFSPDKSKYTPGGKIRKGIEEFRSIDEWLKLIK